MSMSLQRSANDKSTLNISWDNSSFEIGAFARVPGWVIEIDKGHVPDRESHLRTTSHRRCRTPAKSWRWVLRVISSIINPYSWVKQGSPGRGMWIFDHIRGEDNAIARHELHIRVSRTGASEAFIIELRWVGRHWKNISCNTSTHLIDRFSLDMYSLPYGSPQRRINTDF